MAECGPEPPLTPVALATATPVAAIASVPMTVAPMMAIRFFFVLAMSAPLLVALG